MKNTRLIKVADYAIVVLKHLASTTVAPHLPRWPPPAGPAAPGRRSASASPRTAGEKEGEQRARSRRGTGRGTRGARALNYFGQGADLGQHPVGAVQVPAEAEPLREKRRSEPVAGPARPPRSPPPTPIPTMSPALPGPRRYHRVRLCDPEPLPGGLPATPLPAPCP